MKLTLSSALLFVMVTAPVMGADFPAVADRRVISIDLDAGGHHFSETTWLPLGGHEHFIAVDCGKVSAEPHSCVGRKVTAEVRFWVETDVSGAGGVVASVKPELIVIAGSAGKILWSKGSAILVADDGKPNHSVFQVDGQQWPLTITFQPVKSGSVAK